MAALANCRGFAETSSDGDFPYALNEGTESGKRRRRFEYLGNCAGKREKTNLTKTLEHHKLCEGTKSGGRDAKTRNVVGV